MKVAILCGGLGMRLREETELRPKPMIEIGGRPILWHIMSIYARQGLSDFVLCLGYKGDVIRDYFLHYDVRHRDVTVTLGSGEVATHAGSHPEAGWRVTLAETGANAYTGTRLVRAARHLDGPRFLATYGDGVADVDIRALLAFHEKQGKLGTVTAVRPSSRFGELAIEDGMVKVFREKPQVHEGWINGGFFVFQKEALDLVGPGETESLEQGLLVKLAEKGELAVHQHDGFWQCMDTSRELTILRELWDSGHAPWLTTRG